VTVKPVPTEKEWPATIPAQPAPNSMYAIAKPGAIGTVFQKTAIETEAGINKSSSVETTSNITGIP
jgi:hypothetical protein